MKNKFLFAFISLLVLLCGCAPNDAGLKESNQPYGTEELNRLVTQIATANSVEWERIDYTKCQREDGEIVNVSRSEAKYIKTPFTLWVRPIIDEESTSPAVFEPFIEEKNGTLLYSIRYRYTDAADFDIDQNGKSSYGSEPLEPLIWHTTSVTGDEKAARKAMYKTGYNELSYLLSSNIDSFYPSSDALGDVACFRYDGHIKPETVLDYYEETKRDLYVQVGLLGKKENMSREDMKNEIVSGDILELLVDFEKILFCENPAPVSMWVDTTTGSLVKIKIDFTEADASYLTKFTTDDFLTVTVIDSHIEYCNIVFDQLKKLKKPD